MTNSPSAWRRAAGHRLGTFWLAKLLGTSAGMTLFFLGYFWVLHHPAREPIPMPLSRLDLWIGFQPAFLPLYLSLWVYVSLGLGLIAQRRELEQYALTAGALALAGLALFKYVPTRVPPFVETWAPDSPFAFLKQIDASGNACPSLHVAFAVFTAFVLSAQLRQLPTRWTVAAFNWLWCAGIVYSTMATRQHVLYDVVVGAIFGTFFAAGFLLWRRHPGDPTLAQVSAAGSGTTQR